jgi:hypothetical protein
VFLTHGNVPDLSVSVGRRRLRLVIDPLLCLCDTGVQLIRRFEQVAELWLPRELWHILDNSRYFMARPDALFAPQPLPDGQDYRRALFPRGEREVAQAPVASSSARRVCKALQSWEALRLSRDLTGLSLFWLGDGLSESFLPEGARDDLHARFEAAAEWLDGQLVPASPLAVAQRDALALSLALDGAPILAQRGEPGEALLHGGIAPVQVHALTGEDPLVALEASCMREALVRAGCAGLVWRGLKLAVVHVAAPFEVSELAPHSHDERVAEWVEAAPVSDAIALFWYGL